MMMRSVGRLRRPVLRAWVLVAGLAVVGTGARAETAWNVSAGVGETDNVRFTPTDKQSDTIGELGTDFAWHEQRPNYLADVTGDLSYLNYLHHYYNSEVIGNFLGNLQLTLAPEVLRWTFADNFGQGLIDPLAQVTPANREYINYFATGPDLTLPLGGSNALLLDARYAKVTYQTSPLGNNRYTANVGVRHELSSAAGISVDVQDQLIRFDDSVLNPDYDEQEAYVRFDAHGVRTRLDVQVGFDRLKLQHSTANGVLARVEATRQLTPAASLTLVLGHEFSDASEDFRTLQAIGGANLATQATTPTSSPFKNNYGTLEWNYQRNRTTFGFGGGYYRVLYQTNDLLNENRTTFDAHASRRLSPQLELSLVGNYERDGFYNVIGNATQFTATALLTWRASRMIAVVVEYDHSRRESDLRTTEYIDNRGWLKLRYGRSPELPPGSLAPQLPPLPNQPKYQ
jgi:hypothetical protein